MSNFYLSLDEARSELAKRWQDEGLKKAIQQELGSYFLSIFERQPTTVNSRQLASADHGFTFFYHSAHYVGGKPVAFEFLDDKFVCCNPEKKGLARLRVTTEFGIPATMNLANLHASEKLPIHLCTTKQGESLVNFHHRLLKLDGYIKSNLPIVDGSSWYKQFAGATHYYYFFLLHYVAHAVLFEYFYDVGGTNEDRFTHEVVYPAIRRIKEKFGLVPMVVRSFPENQTDDEDFYWWSHSPRVNDYLLDYARQHNIPLVPVKTANR